MGVSRIFWDTNLFIYLLEGSGEHSQRTQEVLVRMSARKDVLITSALTLGEILVKPLETGDGAAAARYEHFLNSPGVEVVSFDREAARVYASLRLDRTIRPPDAIQLSCAAAARCNLFITNDGRLSQKNVAGVDFIVPLKQAYL
jgi:predicted nucleic acid-binding protein